MNSIEEYAPVQVVERGCRWPVPHPMPYQGSKRHIASVILSYFPDNVSRLYEPFAGSAAISLATAYRKLATEFIINDGHGPIAALWEEIVLRPDALADAYEKLWNDQMGRQRAFYDEIRTRFNKTHRPDYFLYLLARCVKAAIRYNGAGEFNNSPDNRRLGAQPETMRERIVGASELLKGRSRITAKDYRDAIQDCTPQDLVYLDPPYQGVTGDRDTRYAPKLSHPEFCDFLAELNKGGIRYVVSYDGRMGGKVYGEPMPKSLALYHIEIAAGRSTTATLLGRDHETFESLYLSPSLAEIIPARFSKKLGREAGSPRRCRTPPAPAHSFPARSRKSRPAHSKTPGPSTPNQTPG